MSNSKKQKIEEVASTPLIHEAVWQPGQWIIALENTNDDLKVNIDKIIEVTADDVIRKRFWGYSNLSFSTDITSLPVIRGVLLTNFELGENTKLIQRYTDKFCSKDHPVVIAQEQMVNVIAVYPQSLRLKKI